MPRARWLDLAFLLDAAGIALFATPEPRAALIAIACALAVLGNAVAYLALADTPARPSRSLFLIAALAALIAAGGLTVEPGFGWPAFAVLIAGAAQMIAWTTAPLASGPSSARSVAWVVVAIALFGVLPLVAVRLDHGSRYDLVPVGLRPGDLHAIRPVTVIVGLAAHGLLCGQLRAEADRPPQTRWLLDLAGVAVWGARGLLALIPLAVDATAAADPILAVLCVAGVAALVVAVWRLQLLGHRTAAAITCSPAIALLATLGPSYASSMFGFVLTAVPITAAAVWAAMARRAPLAHPALDAVMIAAGVALAALHGSTATPADAVLAAGGAINAPWILAIAARALYLAALAARIRAAARSRDVVPTALALR